MQFISLLARRDDNICPLSNLHDFFSVSAGSFSWSCDWSCHFWTWQSCQKIPAQAYQCKSQGHRKFNYHHGSLMWLLSDRCDGMQCQFRCRWCQWMIIASRIIRQWMKKNLSQLATLKSSRCRTKMRSSPPCVCCLMKNCHLMLCGVMRSQLAPSVVEYDIDDITHTFYVSIC